METDFESMQELISQFQEASTGGGGGGSCADFPELLTEQERQAAQSCGTQTLLQFQTADALYDAIEANCEMGDYESAEINYESYKTQVELARKTYDAYCQ